MAYLIGFSPRSSLWDLFLFEESFGRVEQVVFTGATSPVTTASLKKIAEIGAVFVPHHIGRGLTALVISFGIIETTVPAGV